MAGKTLHLDMSASGPLSPKPFDNLKAGKGRGKAKGEHEFKENDKGGTATVEG